MEEQKLALASDFSIGGKGFVLQFREESKRNLQTNQTHKKPAQIFRLGPQYCAGIRESA